MHRNTTNVKPHAKHTPTIHEAHANHTRPRRPHDGPRGPQDGPKTAEEGSKTVQEAPQTAQ
eukprot:953496-Pyramimonas_sp.AAC.1